VDLQTWVAAGIVLGVLASAILLVGTVGRPLRRLSRQNDEFRQDWYGTPARPGRPAVKGVPERLSLIETQLGPSLARVEQRLDDHIRSHGGTS
jgi:hypothetical protein